MSDYTHLETSEGHTFSVACGLHPLKVKVVTDSTQLVTCPLCINSAAYRGTVVRTSVIPTDRAILRRIEQVLREYDRGDHSEDEALALIDNLINRKGPSNGQATG